MQHDHDHNVTRTRANRVSARSYVQQQALTVRVQFGLAIPNRIQLQSVALQPDMRFFVTID